MDNRKHEVLAYEDLVDRMGNLARTEGLGERAEQIIRRSTPVNGPCPCGSGKKFKKCCRSKTFEIKRYRLLNPGEDVQAHDQCLQYDCVRWLPVDPKYVGQLYDPMTMVPVRRP
ncbi:MAG: hypothetical protein GWN00_01070 [Aliifodinibius sp.]|nr:hypothetical protein [Fodinibius sp.]NIV09922.1 hypothetical protein [Fodinibius sp.]NIY23452.1 hypothetical protein [Fodinibius sp.]